MQLADIFEARSSKYLMYFALPMKGSAIQDVSQDSISRVNHVKYLSTLFSLRQLRYEYLL